MKKDLSQKIRNGFHAKHTIDLLKSVDNPDDALEIIERLRETGKYSINDDFLN